MSAPERSAVIKALNAVRDPKSGKGLVEAGLVQGLVAGDGKAGFMMEVAAADAGLYAPVRDEAEAALKALPGAERVQVVLTAEAAPGASARPAEAPGRTPPHTHTHDPVPPGTVRMRRGGARLSPEAQAQAAPQGATPAGLKPPHVAHVIAVASGKGGVGKSTVAVNLACALAAIGRRTGLLDADIYGPSVPRMTGLDAEPEVTADKKLIPLQGWGLKVMSIGLLVDEGSPMIWRGPMASSAVNQMLNDVAWASEAEPLDVLVVDMPPGTGDIQLTLSQRVALSGAVVVSTPQEVALIDARRAVAMFEKTHVPILGLVENMAYFPDPDHRRAHRDLRARRGAGGGQDARRAVPGRNPHRPGAPRGLRRRPAPGRDRPGQRRRQGLPRHRRGRGREARRRRGPQAGAQDRVGRLSCVVRDGRWRALLTMTSFVAAKPPSSS